MTPRQEDGGAGVLSAPMPNTAEFARQLARQPLSMRPLSALAYALRIAQGGGENTEVQGWKDAATADAMASVLRDLGYFVRAGENADGR